MINKFGANTGSLSAAFKKRIEEIAFFYQEIVSEAVYYLIIDALK